MNRTPGSRASARERLKAAALRPTRQRLALAELLFGGAHCHVSAEQLHGEAQAAGVKVSLATVYNTLHHFTRAGLLREVVVEAGRGYFDTNMAHHHHFYHEGEQRLVDIPGDEIRVENLPRPPKGAVLARVDVVIRLRSEKRDRR